MAQLVGAGVDAYALHGLGPSGGQGCRSGLRADECQGSGTRRPRASPTGERGPVGPAVVAGGLGALDGVEQHLSIQVEKLGAPAVASARPTVRARPATSSGTRTVMARSLTAESGPGAGILALEALSALTALPALEALAAFARLLVLGMERSVSETLGLAPCSGYRSSDRAGHHPAHTEQDAQLLAHQLHTPHSAPVGPHRRGPRDRVVVQTLRVRDVLA